MFACIHIRVGAYACVFACIHMCACAYVPVEARGQSCCAPCYLIQRLSPKHGAHHCSMSPKDPAIFAFSLLDIVPQCSTVWHRAWTQVLMLVQYALYWLSSLPRHVNNPLCMGSFCIRVEQSTWAEEFKINVYFCRFCIVRRFGSPLLFHKKTLLIEGTLSFQATLT